MAQLAVTVRTVLQTCACICNRTIARITETKGVLRILHMRNFAVSIISLIFAGGWKCFIRARHAAHGGWGRGVETNKKFQLQILMGGGFVCICTSLRPADDIMM